jgi:hypothetical protein
MISSIYGSNKAMYKIGERKGKTKAEIEKLEKARTKKKPQTKKKIKSNMNIGIKTFNQAQEVKVEITEYPGYFINMAGLVCYKNPNGNGYRYCKKVDKQSVYILVDGKQTIVNEHELADKYVPGWTRFRKVKKQKENKPFVTDTLERIVEANESKVIQILINKGYQISKVGQ